MQHVNDEAGVRIDEQQDDAGRSIFEFCGKPRQDVEQTGWNLGAARRITPHPVNLERRRRRRQRAPIANRASDPPAQDVGHER